MNYAMESFTGIRPTADLTAANYIGALKRTIDDEQIARDKGVEIQSSVFLAEIHAATTADPRDVVCHSHELTRTLIALGYEGEIYSQWDIEDLVAPTEYALRGLTSVARLLRLPTLKDKVGQSDAVESAPVSLAMYPMMMAADIVLARPEFVPTGKDQRPHIEITRELIRAHNRKFGTRLPEPKDKDLVPINIGSLGPDSGKMSKTEPKGAILLDETPEQAKRKIMKAFVPAELGEERDARVDNIVAIAHGLSLPGDARFDEVVQLAGQMRDGLPISRDFKESVAEIVGGFVAGLHEKRQSVSDAEVAARRESGLGYIHPIATETLTELKAAQRRIR